MLVRKPIENEKVSSTYDFKPNLSIFLCMMYLVSKVNTQHVCSRLLSQLWLKVILYNYNTCRKHSLS